MSERAEFCIKGAELLAKPYQYTASGLDNVYLLSGVTINDTPYGKMVTIENINGLHHAIGLHIIEKPKQITGPEFRFLRKQMGLTQSALAERMRVSEQTVANYEKENTKELGPADSLMRINYFLHILPNDMRAKVTKAIAEALSRHGPKRKIPDVPRLKMVEGWREHREAA